LFSRFPTGVAVVLAMDRGQVVGLTVNSLTSASLDPLLLLFCVRNESRSGNAILRVGRFTVNILAAHQESLAQHFAGRKNAHAETEYVRDGDFVWLARSNAVFRCEVEGFHPGGDHRIVLGRVVEMVGPDTCANMLVYHGGHYAHIEMSSAPETLLESKS
jgi:3-hydroxy-9,10-secoandrosta-1,3,5(10)-triene-9,17-dione monooxygenase reductase component